MSKNIFQGIVFSLLFLAFHAKAQDDFCGITNRSFKDGERIVYKVYYNMGFVWVGAGYAVFTTKLTDMAGRKAFHIVGDGKTLKSYDWFFKVRDVYESYIDTATMQPLKFIRNVDEGGYKIYNNVTFDHRNGKATSTNGTFITPKCVQDVLSTIYYARSIDYNKYKPGDKIPFSMFLDDKVYNLFIRYLGKERITTKYGKFNAIKIAPLLIEGTMFDGGEKMTVWVSDDENHIPVRVDSPILVGSIKVDLVGYSQLRNPFKGLISIN
jgi:hypothetical protein